uniref:Bridge-like lipid transfer protein family member 1 C-terminal domain-containing protein n=1 Tax=Glossina brevipalpis TaxID=37001 RepID=A0A1A9WZJ1_9MUSC
MIILLRFLIISSILTSPATDAWPLFAWMTLQSTPEETIISPHILEFLEQTLEPTKADSSESQTPSANTTLLFVVQISCLPVSRVECMLQLPSLDIVFSSKRSVDEEQQPMMGVHISDSTQMPPVSEKDKTPHLSVIECLADFNVYIFHPYGGKKTNIKEAQFSPLTDNERKDSLSINVEFSSDPMMKSLQ